MKKLLSVLIVLAMCCMLMPIAGANNNINNLIEIKTLILEDDGTAAINNSTEYVEGYSRTEVLVYGEAGTPDAGTDSYFCHSWTGEQAHSFRYYPMLNAGTYTVYAYVPAKAYQVPTICYGSDGTSRTMAASTKSTLDYGQTGPGGFVEFGTFEFTGVYGQDYIELKEALTNSHSGYSYNTGWEVYYDALKFEKAEEEADEIILNPGDVNSLIVEETGQSLLNGAEEYSSNYAKTKALGTAFTDMSQTTTGGHNGYYSINWTGEQSKSIVYYPVLNAGTYRVSVYVPARAYQVPVAVYASDGTSKTIGDASVKSELDYGKNGPEKFVEYGTFEFTGIYGQDYIQLKEVLTNSHSGYNYNTAWGVYFDAVKFEKVDERTAAWNLNDSEGKESIGTYTWVVEKGESVNTVSDGFKGLGWNIERPTMDSDIDATTSSGVKISIPSGLYNTTDFAINIWVRNDGITWNQNILEIYQADKQHRWANIRLSNSVLEGHMRSRLNDATSETVGESVNSSTVVDIGRGEWHMVTLVIDNNTATWSAKDPDGAFIMDYFYDGVRIGRRSVANNNGAWRNYLDANTFIYIGADHNGNNRFNGTIDEISFFKEALTEADVLKLYNKETRVQSGITDNIAMATGTTLGEKNTITLSAPGVPTSNTAFDRSTTQDGIFAGELVYVSDIPEGLYVSNVKSGEDKVIVTFAGTADSAVKSNVYIKAAVQRYGTNTANSDSFIATINTSFDLIVSDSKITDGIFTASITNNSYAVNVTVDVVVAVYNSSGKMKDVYLESGVTTPAAGSSFKVTTDVLDYTDGDIAKIFILDSMNTLKPVNAYLS